MPIRRKVLHYRTSGNTQPLSTNLDIGEIAISTNNTSPRLFIKKTNNSIAEFCDKQYIDGKVVSYSSNTLSIYTATLKFDTTYMCNVLTSLTINSIDTIYELNVIFKTGDVVENMPTVPSNCKYCGDLNLEANKEYILSMYNGVIIIVPLKTIE